MGMINGALSIMCAIFSVLLISAFQISPQWRRSQGAKPLLLVMVFTFIMLVCNGVALLWFTGNVLPFSFLATAAEIFALIVEWFFCLFIISQANDTGVLSRIIRIVLGCMCVLGCLLCMSNLIHPFFYDFQNERFLSVGAYYGFAAINYAFFALSVFLLLLKGDNLGSRDRIFLSVTPMLPLTSFLWDYLIPGLSSWYVLVFVSVSANYIYMMFRIAETAQEKIDQLELRRIRATMERIKPHYIYNVLASIYYLCDRNVATAKEAIHIFSDYLREVLNMMEAEALIPMSRELRTVRNYLELEQMRFGDHIHVRYQIDVDDFLLPPFSLQPLVENSVKHGVEQSEKSGEILIASYERPDCYVVVIQDSFEGFDTEAAEADEGSGTKYVREILSMTVDGTLQINSKPGMGTVSMVTIPKKS